MMKKPLLFLHIIFLSLTYSPFAQNIEGSRMKEVFKESILHGTEVANIGDPIPAGNLNNPWEITYGSDRFLWVTEARGYRVRRINPSTGAITTVLDLNPGATGGGLTNPEHTAFNRVTFPNGGAPWPQGGMMGLALHPEFMTNPAKKFVYIGYVRSQGIINGDNSGHFYTNFLVRFTYDVPTNQLTLPVMMCDTLPGSKDHNSGRIIIAPVGGVNYLFYASGDMGAGQFENRIRPIKSQITPSYEGKILRFNLEPDADPGLYNRWIPSGAGLANNPFNGAAQSAVYTKGVRNNQGFAYDPDNLILYGSEHGPFSDDEVNIIESGKNYGHPLLMGKNDGNYDNAAAGSQTGTCPNIGTEAAQFTALGGATTVRPAIYSLFAAPNGPQATPNTVRNIYMSTTGDPGGNNSWHSIAPSGLDIYTKTKIPGWKNSLLLASLKKGKIFRLKLNAAGTGVDPTPITAASPLNDTVGVFFSQNRFRDIAISPDGDTIFAVIDRDGTTSGPTTGSPINSKCPGCIKRYVFLGYPNNAGASTIPTGIPVTAGTANACETGTTININADNTNHWVPITGTDGNILAEIKANGKILGDVTSSFYRHQAPTVRIHNGRRYLNRNIRISPALTTFTGTVSVRLYFTKAEFDSLDFAPGSGVTAITDLKILKNSDACGSGISGIAQTLTPTAFAAHGAAGYVLTAELTGFSSFYFAAVNVTLPLDLLTFTGSLQDNKTQLQWETANEINTSRFLVERSIDGRNFIEIGTVPASVNTTTNKQYSFNDIDVMNQQMPVVYYRLKMVDQDGGMNYSNIVTIFLTNIVGNISVFPNPAADKIKVSFKAAEDNNGQWKVIDNSGRVVMQNIMQIRKGDNNMNINVNNLSPGTYYLSITGDGFDQKVKLQKL